MSYMITKRLLDSLGGPDFMCKLNRGEDRGLCPFCVGPGWNFTTQKCVFCGEEADENPTLMAPNPSDAGLREKECWDEPVGNAQKRSHRKCRDH